MAKPSKFITGADALKEASARTSFSRTEYLKIPENERVIVRFLTDADYDEQHPWLGSWVTVQQHSGVPTMGKPDDYTGDKWPTHMGAVCPLTKLADGSTLGASCYICDSLRNPKDGKPYKAQPRGWAIACVREEVKSEDGKKVIGIKDRMREVEVRGADGKGTGEKTQERDIVLVNFAYSNFFSPLRSFYGMYGTIVDRDYYITREGSQRDTKYQPMPADVLPGYDLRDPAVFARYCGLSDAEITAADGVFTEEQLTLPVNFEDDIERMASEDYFGRFFDPTVRAAADAAQPAEGTEAIPPVPGAPAAVPAEALSQAALADLAARVRTPGAAAAEAPAEAPAPAPATSGGMQAY